MWSVVRDFDLITRLSETNTSGLGIGLESSVSGVRYNGLES